MLPWKLTRWTWNAVNFLLFISQQLAFSGTQSLYMEVLSIMKVKAGQFSRIFQTLEAFTTSCDSEFHMSLMPCVMRHCTLPCPESTASPPVNFTGDRPAAVLLERMKFLIPSLSPPMRVRLIYPSPKEIEWFPNKHHDWLVIWTEVQDSNHYTTPAVLFGCCQKQEAGYGGTTGLLFCKVSLWPTCTPFLPGLKNLLL